MAYVDLSTIQDTDPGDILTAAWCDQVRDNDEFFIDPPACSVFDTTGQDVGTGTISALLADSELFDNDSMHSTSSDTSRITFQTAGRYLLGCVVRFAAGTKTTPRLVQFRYNGSGSTVTNVAQLSALSSASRDTIISGMTVGVFDASDYVEVTVRQETGITINVTLDSFFALFLTRA